MKVSNFLRDSEVGKEGEEMWAKHLVSLGKTVSWPDEGKSYWDMMDCDGVKYEVKYDLKATYHSTRYKKPANLFIEYWSPKRNVPAGIMTSEADILVYIVKWYDIGYTAYKFDSQMFMEHLMSNEYEVKGGKNSGKTSAVGWAVPIEKIIQRLDSGFIDAVIL